MSPIGKNSCSTLGFKKLLISTDGSKSAIEAVNEALSLAKTCSSKLYVLSVIEVNPEYAALASTLVEKAGIKTRKHLETIKKQALKSGIDCETIVHQGEEPYKFIVDEARKKKVDMIIIGSHGRTGIKRLMLGSVASRVIGHAPCKVLVVPV
ncbi:MAG: hypothetical protein A2X59_06880 [Nitrospirae bacterium GWC2_42_7]|nr:MAG: hypothetical protein A2X59_06880 [Nitrospirae bacterium GWC2_42_7]